MLSYLLVYYNIFLAVAIVGLTCKNLYFKKWSDRYELFFLLMLMLGSSLLSLIYQMQPIVMGALFSLNTLLLIAGKRIFKNHSYSGISFYLANYLLMAVGLIWGVNFIQNLDVSAVTKALLLITSPLILLTLPSGIIQVIEMYDVLCRNTWLRPRSPYPSRSRFTHPMVSLHVPAHSEPPDMVIETLNKLSQLDYDTYEVLVIDNNTTDPALYLPLKAHCQKLGDRFKFHHVEGLTGAKAGALNYALKHTDPNAEIIGIIDADYHAKRDFIKALIGHFDDPRIGFVQTPHDYRGWEHNAFLRMCYWEYKIFFYSVLVSLNERESAITVGTMCLIRKNALIASGGWAEWCVTEDSELAIRIHDAGYSSIYVSESYGQGLIPDTFEGYKKQRHRWTAGPVQEFKYHFKRFFHLTSDKSEFTRLQRAHHINHGLNNVIIGLSLPVMLLGIAVVSSMVYHREVINVPFELWLSATVMLVASFILDILVNKTIINPSFKELMGKIFASKALRHTITLSAFKTLLNNNVSWNRTNKFKSKYSYLSALSSTADETLIGVLLIIFITFSFNALPYTGLALMFMIGLFYTATSYFSAPLLGIVSAWSLNTEHSVVKYRDAFRYAIACVSIVLISAGSVITFRAMLMAPPADLLSPLASEQVSHNQGEILAGISTSRVQERSTAYMHIVGEGETLWSIAHDYLGSGYSWEYIDNPKGGKNVRPGDIVYLPSALVIKR